MELGLKEKVLIFMNVFKTLVMTIQISLDAMLLAKKLDFNFRFDSL